MGPIQDKGTYDAPHHGLFHIAIRLQGNQDAQVIRLPVEFFNDLIIKPLCHQKAGLHHFVVQKLLHDIRLKSAEDIACAKMDPFRGRERLLPNSLTVKLRKRISGRFPSAPILNSRIV